MLRPLFLQTAAALGLCITASAFAPALASPEQIKDRAALAAPGSVPFHLKAIAQENGDPTETQIEIYWNGPLQWRRTIQGEDFSQTLIHDHDKIFEDDSDDYFPLELRSLIAAMVDSEPRIGEMRVQFSDYRDFLGKKVARIVYVNPQFGDSWKAQITELTPLKDADERLFTIPQETPTGSQIRVESLQEAEFWKLASEKYEIVWPQVLDGAVTGVGRYYVSIDRTGKVREVYPIQIDMSARMIRLAGKSWPGNSNRL